MSHFPETEGSMQLNVKNEAGVVVKSFSSNPISATLVTKDLDFDRRQAIKYVDVIMGEVKEGANLEGIRVDVGYRDSLTDPVIWQTGPTLDMLDQLLFCRISTRYIKLRILSDSVGVFWRLAALEVYGTFDGQRF